MRSPKVGAVIDRVGAWSGEGSAAASPGLTLAPSAVVAEIQHRHDVGVAAV
jgi:hypothetical protein